MAYFQFTMILSACLLALLLLWMALEYREQKLIERLQSVRKSSSQPDYFGPWSKGEKITTIASEFDVDPGVVAACIERKLEEWRAANRYDSKRMWWLEAINLERYRRRFTGLPGWYEPELNALLARVSEDQKKLGCGDSLHYLTDDQLADLERKYQAV